MKKRLPLSYKILFFSYTVFLIACNSGKNYYRSFNYPYEIDVKDLLMADVQVVHSDDRYSYLYYSISSSQLKYKKTDFDSLYTSAIKVSYEYPDKKSSRAKGDTAFFIFYDHVKKTKEHLVTGKIKLKIPSGYYGYIDFSFFDMNSGKRGLKCVFVNKKSRSTSCNFLVQRKGHKMSNWNFYQKYDTLLISNERVKNAHQLFVRFFEFEQMMAFPPFSPIESLSPSKFSNQFILNAFDGKFFLPVSSQGVYLCRTDTSSSEGLSLIALDNDKFQEVSKEQKLYSLRYILTNDEYSKLVSGEVKDEEIWEQFAGSKQRSLMLMKEWCRRIMVSNFFFTRNKEGYKSDQGMIYLVFGSPSIVERTNEKERWHYGLESSLNSFIFEFERVPDGLFEDNFRLIRGTQNKTKWYNAVDIWRNGRVYGGN